MPETAASQHLLELFGGELKESIHTGIVLLAAPVGEVETRPATEILTSWKEIEDSNAPSTWDAVLHPWTAEPRAPSAEVTPCGRYPDAFLPPDLRARKGASDSVKNVKNRSSLPVLEQPEGDAPNLRAVGIGPLAGAPGAGLGAKNPGAQEV